MGSSGVLLYVPGQGLRGSHHTVPCWDAEGSRGVCTGQLFKSQHTGIWTVEGEQLSLGEGQGQPCPLQRDPEWFHPSTEQGGKTA